jgi:uncharacterized protein YbjQ (UPF0145 family)
MQTIIRGIAGAVFAFIALGAPVAAQQAVQVALIEGDAQGDYRAAGAVSAEVQSTSNTLPKQKLDEQLRAEAAKLGADAVIQVTYQMTPAASGVSYKATGVAIRYSRQSGAVAAVAPPVVAPAPVAAPLAVVPPPAVVAAAPVAVAVVRAGSAAQVELSETSMPGRRYVRLGPVSARAHQTSLFPKTPAREQVQDALKAAAFKMGADAVIEVKYEMVNAMMSKKGNSASGIAVKFE